MLKKNYTYNVYFYAYSLLCIFLIDAFSSTRSGWMFGNTSLETFCETPRNDADAFLNFIIIPLSIPFLLVKRTPPKIITYLAILLYYSGSFYTRISICPYK
ncbi:DUF2645 family protein [Pectobacterium parmentieri]|uniref:DUF2645 domain-containing protein n=1 Tax=Pectobacterium parmentieri TaxID=1905730 RepID=A0A8B3FI39_PECPM|nr:DUF2645 family protein [Pectobacterium parmentieri]ACX86363.1 conserved hypothetical protein [Pectobacterium parmentieri WPP163]AOR60328.1 hypothetical protein A8F97_15710 [Pectobacterium parmentieri]AYG99959.1 DUF2645 domain-containing protein [Pectobacterium parmentieri]AYH04439.1 DUF2645 domain-containing protein [Pectobacterium parmentieri]AYH08715.1 DUF2645 domain-containing protein [Pectobacterium parmentieri]